jgi:hypothetical protein
MEIGLKQARHARNNSTIDHKWKSDDVHNNNNSTISHLVNSSFDRRGVNRSVMEAKHETTSDLPYVSSP